MSALPRTTDEATGLRVMTLPDGSLEMTHSHVYDVPPLIVRAHVWTREPIHDQRTEIERNRAERPCHGLAWVTAVVDGVATVECYEHRVQAVRP